MLDVYITYNKDNMPKYLTNKVKPHNLVMLEVKVKARLDGSLKAKVRMMEVYKIGFKLVSMNLL